MKEASNGCAYDIRHHDKFLTVQIYVYKQDPENKQQMAMLKYLMLRQPKQHTNPHKYSLCKIKGL
jgi:hypothetical protein